MNVCNPSTLNGGYIKRLEFQGDISSISSADQDGDNDQVVDVQCKEVQIPRFQQSFAVYLSVVRRTDCRKVCCSDAASRRQPLNKVQIKIEDSRYLLQCNRLRLK